MVQEQMYARNEKVDIEYRRKKNAEEMKHQVISFALMILFTLAAFAAVGYEGFSGGFIVPLILVLAVVQVAFQLYYFMHMSQRGHEAPSLFLYSGVLVGFATIIAFMTIIWW